MSDHDHQELEDRITLEITALQGQITGLQGNIVTLNAKVSAIDSRLVALQREVHQGFIATTQILGQLIARLPEPPAGDTP